ncbi:MAG: argininosuccinate lyase [Desulfobacteraceae bacterium]
MGEKVWGGRFREELDRVLDRFNASLGFDMRLYPQDIRGSIAHCRMLADKGILDADEADRIIAGLEEIRGELDRGERGSGEGHEDVHSLVESLLVKKVGPIGEKLHTARSRNDQVALDERLFVREAVEGVRGAIRGMQAALVEQAEANIDLILPGYTHLQRAQPVLLAHHLMAYVEMLGRDLDRFTESLTRVNVMPFGSAALAGAGFDLDREMVAAELGFESLSRNSMDAVSDRDFVLEFLSASSILMMHLSRLSEEIILWSTQEFGFVSLPDAFCTGSSIMPQKKNPDLPELVRGKTGRVYGNLTAVLTAMKGLPLSYNKDMQEDKERLFDTVDTVADSLEVMTRLLRRLSFRGEAMKSAVEKGFLAATDLADYLVLKGVTFRKAHEAVGGMVVYAFERGLELPQLTLEEMRNFSRGIEEDVYEWLDPAACVARRNLPGGTGPQAVKAAIQRAREEIGL